jgi:hypothetical protein
LSGDLTIVALAAGALGTTTGQGNSTLILQGQAVLLRVLDLLLAAYPNPAIMTPSDVATVADAIRMISDEGLTEVLQYESLRVMQMYVLIECSFVHFCVFYV